MRPRAVAVVALAVGACFGFLLTASGLGNYRTIHDGLLLRDGYIYLMLASTVGTSAAGIWVLKRRGRTAYGGPLRLPHNPVRRQTVYGGALFGVGFGVAATCPGITVAALAVGAWWGVVTLAGILAGLLLRGWAETRGH